MSRCDRHDTSIASRQTEWDRLPPEDKEGMVLATEARTHGSQGAKCGNDVGAVLVIPKKLEEGGEFWQVLSWGCARTLELGRSGVQQETNVSSFEFDTHEPKKRKAATKKIDIHAEVDALSYAARQGVAIDGATAYVTRPPCNRCLPALIAAGVTRVVYSDTIVRHTSAENAERQLRVASECGVQLVQDVPPVPHEYAKYGEWLRGKETRLSARSEI